MNDSKFKKILSIVLKIEFKIPAKNKIFLVSGSKNNFLKKIIKKNLTVYNREKFNFFILILLIFKKKFSSFDFHLNYLETYLRFAQAKVFISTIDNNPLYWSIKKRIPNLIVLLIQNGWRMKNGDIFNEKKLILKNKYQVDYFFTFNSSFSKLYSKYIDANFISIGSYINNFNSVNKCKKNNKILYLSEFKNEKDIIKSKKNKTPYDYYTRPDRHLLPFLKEFCLKNKFRFEILPRSFSEKEYLFYRNILGTKGWVYKNNVKNSYKYTDKVNLVVFICTTLGYEVIARKNKLAGFCCKLDPYLPQKKGSRSFGWPIYGYKDSGFFWVNKMNLNNFEKKLNNLMKMSKTQWNLKISNYRDDIMIYNKNNYKLRKIISKVCNNL
jgi:surface carbohydrate biosynthesis protein